jgi:hypothetical protein
MASSHEPRSAALRAAAHRRIELKEALSQVEVAAASPSGEPAWRERVLQQLHALQIALLQHVDEVEDENGLLAELLEVAPRLANQIAHVRDEHPVLCEQVASTIAVAETCSDVEQIRSTILLVLNAIARHRQKGADLVYEGYDVDIGGS